MTDRTLDDLAVKYKADDDRPFWEADTQQRSHAIAMRIERAINAEIEILHQMGVPKREARTEGHRAVYRIAGRYRDAGL